MAATYWEAGSPPIVTVQPEPEPDMDMLLRMAEEHGALTAKVAVFSGQVRELRGTLRRVLKATERFSDSRRAPWWLEAHHSLRRSADV